LVDFFGSTEQIIPRLGLVNLFQTFEDLESVKDKQADAQAARQLLDEAVAAQADREVILYFARTLAYDIVTARQRYSYYCRKYVPLGMR
jgi:hypothetical protein